MRLAAVHALLAISLLSGVPHGCGGGDDDDDDDDTGLPPADGSEREPNDSSSQANTVTIGQTIQGTMEPGDRDFFRIDVPAGYADYKLSITVEDAGRNCFEGTDPNLEVLASDGHTRLHWMEDSVEDYCPRLEFVVEPGTTYYAAIGTDVGLTGNYTLSLKAGGTGTVSGTVSSGGAGRPAGPRPAASREVLAPIMDGEMLVSFAPGEPVEVQRRRLKEHLGRELEVVRPVMGGRYHLLKVQLPEMPGAGARRALTLELITKARLLPGVLLVEPNRILEPQKVVDDTLYSEQWDFREFPGMNVERAWDLWTGSASTVVAVIDTGNDDAHEDLQGKVAGGYDFITNVKSAGDGDGPDDDPEDALEDGHGTHVAGTIAAATNNVTGVAGVGYDVGYLALRVCGNFGCTEADIIEAIYYAAGFESVAGGGRSEPRAEVINMSLGGHDYCSVPLQSAIAAASQRGVIVVAAAGNSAEDATIHSPANCEDVVTVGATDYYGSRAGFSNYGPIIDVMAPGDGILSTFYGGQYAWLGGTSMATPHVAGLAALLKDINPTFGFDSVLELLRTGAKEVDCDGPVGGCGAGLVDAEAAVRAALERPDDPETTAVVVRAVEVTDASRVYHAVALDGAFELIGLAAGTYRIEAFVDGNGDFEPDGEADVSEASSTLTVTTRGEDHSGVGIILP